MEPESNQFSDKLSGCNPVGVAFVASALPDDPYFDEALRSYFPKKMQKPHSADIASHRLRREIISTLLGNDAINRGGPAFVIGMGDKSGATADEIVKAFVLARDGLMLNQLYAQVDELDTRVPGAVQNQLYSRISDTLKTVTGCTKINSAALGNIVRQLHVHVVARSEGDPGWPGPVWGYGSREPYKRSDIHQFAQRIKAAL